MKIIREQYIVYRGEEVQETFSDIEKAKEFFKSLPSGEGKRPGLRRQLVKELILMEDKR